MHARTPGAAQLTCTSVVGLKQQTTTLQRTTTQRCLAQMRKTPPPFMITSIFALLVACIALPLISPTSAAASAPRVSVNVFDAWYNRLPGGHGRAVSLQHMTEACTASGFTVIRVATAPFWPVDAKLLSDDEQQYWALMDEFVADASALILSIFWNAWMFADLHGDPLRTMWTNASSASNRASVSFASTLVQRFSSNPTVFAWEIGNEHNLLTDLNCSGQTWGCAPQLGTPAVRTSADSSSSRDYLLFQSCIVAVIRQHDSLRRPISSGHSLPRPSAYHLMHSFPRSDWTLDSIEQFHSMLLLMAGGCDWASVHFYADDVTRFGFSGAQLLQNACAACGAANLSLYVGEFGDDKSKGGGLPVSNAVLQFLSATPCAALARPSTIWVWELWQQNGTYALYPDDAEDKPLVDAMQELNNRP